MASKMSALGISTVDVKDRVRAAPAQPQGHRATTPADDVKMKRDAGF